LTAASLGWKFHDTDRLTEERTGKSVAELFAERGEPEFRKLEIQVLRDICREGPMVASLGGGTLMNREAMALVRQHGVLVGLRASPEVILERANRKKDSRPLLAGLDDQAKLEKIRRLQAERQPLYDQADLQFDSEEAVPHHALTRRIIHRLQVEELDPLWVELGSRRYPIYIEEDLSEHIDSIAEKVGCPGPFALVSDTHVRSAQGPLLERIRSALGGSSSFYWKPGEGEKELSSVYKLITWMLRQGFSRRTTVIACGGGVVGDMAGFAAAIFLRGVHFLQVPTTLLAMVDSSVGGKTGVNHPLGKNLIGAFHQPRAVIANLAALATLPRPEFLAGLAEIAKAAVIRDAEFFAYLEEHAAGLLQRDAAALKHAIRRACAIKAEIVGQDEREQQAGGRALLNYGHTFGHAFEQMTNYGMAHGLAVALGMRCAARLAKDLGRISASEEARHDALLDKLDLPRKFPGKLDPEKAWKAMALDKKAEAGKRVFILPCRIGEAGEVANPPREAVDAALQAVTA
jgi:3-dehydroquinate synthase/shikimate kinase/3-dehydroquinate synthase